MVGKRELELMCKIQASKSLEEICDLCYELFGNPVFVEDLSHTVLAKTTCVTLESPEWIDNEPQFKPTSEQIEMRRQIISQLIQNPHPQLLTDDALAAPRMLCALIHKGQPIGVVVVVALIRPFREEDSDILSLLVEKITDRLANRSFVLTGESAQVTNLFIQLLNGDKLSTRQAAKRLSVSYWTKKQYFRVIVISDARGELFCSPEDLKISRMFVDNVSFPYQSYYVVIWKSDEDVTDWLQIPEMQELLASKRYYVGISRSFNQPQMAQLHYCEAVSALMLALKMKIFPTRHMAEYGEIAFFHLLDMTAPNCNLLSFCNRSVLDIAKYDERHKTDLLHTLSVYLDCCKDLNASAAVLDVHKNTVRNRINRCLELIDVDLENGADIFSLLFSMRVLEYCRNLNKLPDDPDREALSDS
jgi:sugar diacid utilization regulator